MRILLLLLSWILGYFLAGSLREIQRGLQALIYKSSVPFFGELGHPLQDNRYNSVIQVLSDWHCFQFLCDGDIGTSSVGIAIILLQIYYVCVIYLKG